MATTIVPAMELRRRAGELLARIRYAGERFVIERHGEPIAALVSIEDLRRLEAPKASPSPEQTAQQQALTQAQTIREAVLARRGGEPLPDSADDVRRLREERSNALAGLR